MLSSQKLSIPTSSLIDFDLVSDLGLKMSDLQCSKFTFGGQKFRILGKISQTVQTIKNGVIVGTVHLRASVVEGLRSVFDSHSIAGQKFTEILSRKVSHTTSQPENSPTSPKPARSVKTKTPAKKKPPPCQLNSPEPLKSLKTSSTPSMKSHPIATRTPSPSPSEPDTDYRYGRTSFVSAPRGKLREVEVEIMYHDKKENMVQSVVTCQRITPKYCPQPPLQAGDLVLFRTFDHWTLPDYQLNPVMMSEDEHIIYKIFSSEEEAELTTEGIHIPELPPELNPHGYYGC